MQDKLHATKIFVQYVQANFLQVFKYLRESLYIVADHRDRLP